MPLQTSTKKFGFLSESVLNIGFKGIEGIAKMKELISVWRENPPTEIGGVKVKEFRDYMTYVGKIKLPKRKCHVLLFREWELVLLKTVGYRAEIENLCLRKGNDKTRSRCCL